MSIFDRFKRPSTSHDTTADTPPTDDTVTETPKKEPHPVIEIIQFALIALIIVIPVRWFIAQPFIVSGSSMENTFHSGDYLIVDQISYYFHQPQAGDVIVFRYPRNPSIFFIKRIIGVPGDTIQINGNIVTITNKQHPKGEVLKEPYITPMSPTTFLKEKLGPNDYFVMGDNRDKSSDSRVWGILPRQNIIGRVFLRLYPFNHAGIWPGAYPQTGTDVTNVTSTT